MRNLLVKIRHFLVSTRCGDKHGTIKVIVSQNESHTNYISTINLVTFGGPIPGEIEILKRKYINGTIHKYVDDYEQNVCVILIHRPSVLFTIMSLLNS